MTKTITTEIEYCYELSSAIVPNIQIDELYKTRLSIEYELKTASGELVKIENVQHYSEPSETRMTAQEVTLWVAENRDNFIAADKLELAGYGN